jgi:hypothetical protein
MHLSIACVAGYISNVSGAGVSSYSQVGRISSPTPPFGALPRPTSEAVMSLPGGSRAWPYQLACHVSDLPNSLFAVLASAPLHCKTLGNTSFSPAK